MTLEEKAAQMMCVWQKKAETLVDAEGGFDLQKAKAAFKNGRGLGQVGRPSDAGKGQEARGMAELTNAIQRFFLENTRLGIPVIFHEECLHGHAAIDATSFPQPIALGATFNPDLAESLFTMTAWEARLRGTHQALTPVVDVARDPRWGRVEETYGEDPYLVSRMGIAAVRGFQGDATFRDKKRVIATLKHFAAHGQPESGINCAPANISTRVLRETFLYTFKEAIQKGGAISVMASYNEIDRRAVPRQSVALAGRAPQGVGLPRVRSVGLLCDLGIEPARRSPRPLSGQRQEGSVRSGRSRRRQYRVARTGVLLASG
jgi:beta-glucosidase